jgi:hypothetical protein
MWRGGAYERLHWQMVIAEELPLVGGKMNLMRCDMIFVKTAGSTRPWLLMLCHGTWSL